MAPVTRSRTAKGGHIELTDVEPLLSRTVDSRQPRNSDIMSEADASSAFTPPVYTIDLSLPPAERYVAVAKDFLFALRDLPKIFDELLDEAGLSRKIFHFLTRMLLHRLHSSEQTEELKGIRRVTGIPMYLLVAYNVLLDLMMGCTSGAALTLVDESQRTARLKMLHFRTLDWGMPKLRQIIVQFEFKKRARGSVIARAVNYVGYVGILTAVRKGLSVSLNNRPYHNNDDSRWENLKYRTHQLLVLLGFRPSIPAQLRSFFISPSDTGSSGIVDRTAYNLRDIAKYFPSAPTCATYLVFSDGKKAMLLEKDRKTAQVIESSTFLVATNHDVSYERPGAQAAHAAHANKTFAGVGMDEIVKESIERKGCIVAVWEKIAERLKSKDSSVTPFVTLAQLEETVLMRPITDGVTHFSTIMDPREGSIVWVKAYEESEDADEVESAEDSA